MMIFGLLQHTKEPSLCLGAIERPHWSLWGNSEIEIIFMPCRTRGPSCTTLGQRSMLIITGRLRLMEAREIPPTTSRADQT
jgi:hypothetical protein